MDFKRKYRTLRTKDIPFPNEYIEALTGEFAPWTFTEEEVLENKGIWRSDIFKVDDDQALDLEIGTGNGFHFANYALNNKSRNIIGLELKYKPLIQSIRRARNNGSTNMRMARYNASVLKYIFNQNELDNVIIHHPDPWLKKSQNKNRLIQDEFLSDLYLIQKENTYLDFKTDDLSYIEWALECFENSQYQITRKTFDLHNSEWSSENFVTAFEKIFISKGQPIYYCRLEK